uniref:Uncharacterized protein n=1 Tax=Oryza rufipogon TaxID=4529 RepID=A0A0E0Q1P1_ORYRU
MVAGRSKTAQEIEEADCKFFWRSTAKGTALPSRASLSPGAAWFGMGGVGTCRDGTIVTKFPGPLDQRTGSRNVYMDELFVNHGGHRAGFAAPSPELCHPWKDGGSIDKGKMVVKSHLARSRRPDSTPVIMEEEN